MIAQHQIIQQMPAKTGDNDKKTGATFEPSVRTSAIFIRIAKHEHFDISCAVAILIKNLYPRSGQQALYQKNHYPEVVIISTSAIIISEHNRHLANQKTVKS